MTRPKKTAGFSLRFLPDDRQKLDALAEADEVSASEFIARLIREAWKKRQKKADEVK